ncbi:MAG: hypothetical protein IPM82_28700 [Saprospiraceae bacterium]|nr:hypothetical protein [Saprospiraceae bacterium]
MPTESVTLDLISIIDSFNCLLDTALTGGLVIEVRGRSVVTNPTMWLSATATRLLSVLRRKASVTALSTINGK